MVIITEQEESEMIEHIIIEEAVKLLNSKQQTVLGLILTGYTQSETAYLLQISRSSVGDCYRESIAIIKRAFERNEKNAQVPR